MEGLPEDHIARCWWEGRMPALSSGGNWPQRPTSGGFDAKRDAVGQKIHLGPLLVDRLKAQYANAQLAYPVRLQDLSDPQSRTVTTGHQLCLAGGPAFTFYKIQTAITLALRLQERWKTPVVPVFWLASEDHDFDEVRSLWNGAQWQTWRPEPQQGGAVGRMSTKGLEGELQSWASALELSGSGADGLKFPKDSTMSQAMRHWVHAMFGPEQVVVIDGDDPALKATFIETMQREVRESLTLEAVSSCNSDLETAGFKPQVHVRPCNLFHVVPGGRHRLTASGQMWQSLGGAQWEGTEALCQHIADHPEEFSPNALLRPVYQAQLLPDVAMVGGLAEVAYGMQLPGVFARLGMEQPVLVPRDSAVVLPKRWSNAATKAGLTDAALLEPKATWVQGVVNQAEAPDAAAWRLSMQEQAAKASEALVQVDRSLEGSVNAALAKMENLLDRLEQQTVKAVKRKESDAMSRLDRLDGWVRPNGKPQERIYSFFHLASEWQQQAEDAAPLEEALAQASLRGHEAADWSPLVHVIRSGPH
ncbi:MAG: bacillithiol biosynthesis cysteine-adding enzyme BshC [Flavobacteriales bacterium]|nr:bacillithiol biosynthesis cysteine-adding enzyme BshC [Flavobacteriales bacterium]